MQRTVNGAKFVGITLSFNRGKAGKRLRTQVFIDSPDLKSSSGFCILELGQVTRGSEGHQSGDEESDMGNMKEVACSGRGCRERCRNQGGKGIKVCSRISGEGAFGPLTKVGNPGRPGGK